MDGRQTIELDANWQLSVQQSSFEGSQTEFVVYLHVVGSQQLLSPHPSGPPQSHSSPISTIPLPHWEPEMIGTFLLSVRHCVFTAFLPIAEQMLPTEQGEKFRMLEPVDGFMTKRPDAGQVSRESGQQS